MPNQHRLDVAYILMVKTWAETMSHARRAKNGCLIVKDGQIISDGYNGTPNGFDNKCEFDDRDETKPEVLHAESNALLKLAGSTNSSIGATAYLTMEPCFDCAKMIIQARISRVVFLHSYRLHDGLELLSRTKTRIGLQQVKLDPRLLSSHSQLVKRAISQYC